MEIEARSRLAEQQIQQLEGKIQQAEREKYYITRQLGQEKYQAVREKVRQLAQMSQQLEESKRLEQERDQAVRETVRQLGRVNWRLEESERLILDFGIRNTELEEQLRVMRSQLQEKDGKQK